MRLNCPHCGTLLEVPDTPSSERFACSVCGQRFRWDAPKITVPAAPAAGPRRPPKRPLPVARMIIGTLAITGFIVLSVVVVQKAKEESRTGLSGTTPAGPAPAAAEASTDEYGLIGATPGAGHVFSETESAPSPAGSTVATKVPSYITTPSGPPPTPQPSDFTRVGSNERRARHPYPWGGWIEPEGQKCARESFISIGPLGARALAHIPERMGMPAFKAAVPDAWMDSAGDLAEPVLEIVGITPGSPADGHLRVGDVIFRINGGPLLPGRAYKPEKSYPTKERRSLQPQIGDAIDEAEERGSIQFSVWRPGPEGAAAKIPDSARIAGARGKMAGGPVLKGNTKEVDLIAPTAGLAQIALRVDNGGDGMDGDGTAWVNPRFLGPGVDCPATALPMLMSTVGYGGITAGLTDAKQISSYGGVTNVILTHAVSEILYAVPAGATGIVVTARATSYGAVQPTLIGVRARTLADYPSGHRSHMSDITIPLPRIGRFKPGFPADCPKTRWVVQQQAAWLAAQQLEDGSWPRWTGYTTPAYDTAFCGLALMSTGDPQYTNAIQRAAHAVAYKIPADHWAVPRATTLLFLSEYYLRTRDREIVDGITLAARRVAECTLFDGSVGHGLRHPGYGTSGLNLGTGISIAGLAVAARTPAAMDPRLMPSIVRYLDSVIIDGGVPYGRAWNTEQRRGSARALGSAARTGPSLAGMALSPQGSDAFIQEALAFYRDTVGAGDVCHATQSLAFFGTIIGLASADRPLLEDHLAALQYKVALDRCFEGGVVVSEYPHDYQGAEGVISDFIRTSIHILALTASRHTLAVTGSPVYAVSKRLPGAGVHHWDYFVLRRYMNDWTVALSLLGKSAPPALARGIQTMQEIKPGPDLHARTFEFLEREALPLAREIYKLGDLPPVTRAHAIELVLGVDLRLDAEYQEGERKHAMKLTVIGPLFERLRWAEDPVIEAARRTPLMSFSGAVEITDPSGKLAGPVKFTWDDNPNGLDVRGARRTLNQTVAQRSGGTERFVAPARIRYTVAGMNLDYSREMPFHEPRNIVGRNMYAAERRISVRGVVERDSIGQEVLLRLPGGPPIGLMWPEGSPERIRLPDGTWLDNAEKTRPLLQGDEVQVEYVSSDMDAGALMRAALLKTYATEVRPASLAPETPGLGFEGQPGALSDGKNDTRVRITGIPANGAVSFSVRFASATSVNGLRVPDGGMDGRIQIMRISQETASGPRLLYVGRPFPTIAFPVVQTDRLKIEMQVNGTQPVNLNELQFIHNPRRTAGDPWSWKPDAKRAP